MSPEDLFGTVPPAPTTKKESHKELAGHLWTEQKSLLIAEYIHGFLHVTKSGAFVDLFAGPQNENKENYDDDWSIKRVIERREDASAPCVGYFAACDKKAKQVARLTKLKEANADREITFEIYRGDANAKIGEMLTGVPPKLPCICLIDQRTFECDWATVERIAKFRTEPYKIELFYFLAASWIDRARAKKKPDLLRRWWGRDDYAEFFQLSGLQRALAMTKRFKSELGYQYAHPWSIHKRGVGGQTMYYMIHASDHHRASALMGDAYNAANRIGFNAMDQVEMFTKLDSEL